MTTIDANGRAYVQGWFQSRCHSCVSRVAEYNGSIIMANHEHLDRLFDSDFGDHWNKWRRENPEIVPDLSGADLSGRFLHDTNLTRADLRRVDLSRSHLYHADLSGATAHGLIAKEAKFFDCNLDRNTFVDALSIVSDVAVRSSDYLDRKAEPAKLT